MLVIDILDDFTNMFTLPRSSHPAFPANHLYVTSPLDEKVWWLQETMPTMRLSRAPRHMEIHTQTPTQQSTLDWCRRAAG